MSRSPSTMRMPLPLALEVSLRLPGTYVICVAGQPAPDHGVVLVLQEPKLESGSGLSTGLGGNAGGMPTVTLSRVPQSPEGQLQLYGAPVTLSAFCLYLFTSV